MPTRPGKGAGRWVTIDRPGRYGSIGVGGAGKYQAMRANRYIGVYATLEEAEAGMDADVAAYPPKLRPRADGTPSGERRASGAGGTAASRAVRAYLTALRDAPPKPVMLGVDGFPARSDDPTEIAAAADALAEQAQSGTDVLAVLRTSQKVIDLRGWAHAFAQAAEAGDLEAGFVEHAANYAKSAGITREAFRAVGVPSDVLDRAGL